MFENYISINRLLRSITTRCRDAIELSGHDSNGYVQGTIGDYIKRDVRDVLRLWPPDLSDANLQKVSECFERSRYDRKQFEEVLNNLLPRIEDALDDYIRARPRGDVGTALLDLLHPVVFESSFDLFRAGRYRDAVLNGILAVFDLIRSRVYSDKDGIQLIGEVFSLDHPKLIFSEIETESGKNDQKGFIQILQGAYIGIRNPKAHSLVSDLDQTKAGQYLVFASLLARRVSEAMAPTDPI
jgi:uncharacterized protein (TIGR02391 family)